MASWVHVGESAGERRKRPEPGALAHTLCGSIESTAVLWRANKRKAQSVKMSRQKASHCSYKMVFNITSKTEAHRFRLVARELVINHSLPIVKGSQRGIEQRLVVRKHIGKKKKTPANLSHKLFLFPFLLSIFHYG